MLANSVHPVPDLVPVFFRGNVHSAVPVDDPGDDFAEDGVIRIAVMIIDAARRKIGQVVDGDLLHEFLPTKT